MDLQWTVADGADGIEPPIVHHGHDLDFGRLWG